MEKPGVFFFRGLALLFIPVCSGYGPRLPGRVNRGAADR